MSKGFCIFCWARINFYSSCCFSSPIVHNDIINTEKLNWWWSYIFCTKWTNINPLYCLGVPLSPKLDCFCLPHLTVMVGSHISSILNILIVGFCFCSASGLLGTNFVHLLISVSFFISSQPRFESCTTGSLKQRAAVVYTGTKGSVSSLLSMRFTAESPSS